MRFTSRYKVIAAALLVLGIVTTVGDVSLASNMGFKMNRVIEPVGAGSKGVNIVSVPVRNPYGNHAENLCLPLGLTIAAAEPRGRVLRVNACTGVTSSDACDGINVVDWPTGEAVIVTNPTGPVGGILVGSHQSPTCQGICGVGVGAKGTNYLNIPYHTISTTGESLCAEAGLVTAGAEPRGRVLRVNAATGVTSSDACDGTGVVTLVLGEGVIMTNPSDVASFCLGHF